MSRIFKNYNWDMPKTPSKITKRHMYDMVKIDTIVFEIVGGGEAFKAPLRIVSCLKYPGLDRIVIVIVFYVYVTKYHGQPCRMPLESLDTQCQRCLHH